MSVVILGGNECMAGQYESICREHGCKAKVFTKENGSLRKKVGTPDLLILFISTVSHKMGGTLKNRLGNPDLLVMFTDTISHKMVQNALNETRGQDTVIIRSRSSSMSALGNILETHAGPKS